MRIAKPDYIPSISDILRARIETNGVFETRFTVSDLIVHLFDAGQRANKWIRQFGSVFIFTFIVDLAGYDVYLPGSLSTGITKSLKLFDFVVNSHWTTSSPIILVLGNVEGFEHKLAESPLANYFPGYSGGNDGERASKYILSLFRQANRGNRILVPRFIELNDVPSVVRLITQAIRDAVGIHQRELYCKFLTH